MNVAARIAMLALLASLQKQVMGLEQELAAQAQPVAMVSAAPVMNNPTVVISVPAPINPVLTQAQEKLNSDASCMPPQEPGQDITAMQAQQAQCDAVTSADQQTVNELQTDQPTLGSASTSTVQCPPQSVIDEWNADLPELAIVENPADEAHGVPQKEFGATQIANLYAFWKIEKADTLGFSSSDLSQCGIENLNNYQASQ